jgi:cytochrome c
MNKISITAAALCLLAGPVFAESHAMAEPTGDAAAGEAVFRQCQTCHVVENADGEVLAGRNAKTGPNLYGIAGRTAGSVEDFRYKDSIVAAGEGGLVWDETTFVAYVQDPQGFLRTTLDDSKARSGMSFRLRSEDDAVNLWAYLYSLAPPEAATN